MKLFFHAKSCISGFYHNLARNAAEGSVERNLAVSGKVVLKNRVVSEAHQEDGIIAFEDCRNLSL